MVADSETREMLQSFVSEAFDSLDSNEPLVENLRNDDNVESLNSIFRVFHTLKGLSGFFEMKVINHLTHEAETLLDIIRHQGGKQSESTITIIYQTFDLLRDLLRKVNDQMTDISGEEDAENLVWVIRDCIDTLNGSIDLASQNSLTSPENFEKETIIPETSDVKDEDEQAFEKKNQNDEDTNYSNLINDDVVEQYLNAASELIDRAEKNLLELEENPSNFALVGDTFGAIHSLKGNSGFMGFADVEELSSEMETILDCLRNKTLDVEQNIITILLSNIETIRGRLEIISNRSAGKDTDKESISDDEFFSLLGNIKTNEIVTTERSPVVEVVDTKKSSAPENIIPKSSPVQQAAGKPSDDSSKVFNQVVKKDIRVETIKIDKLFDLVGELITIETMVTSNSDLRGLEIPNFHKSANMLNKITRELQEITMSIRMMPLEGLFNKMKRLVRDVSLKMNKKVNLVVSGQETEMDKNVIDEIADPLVHIIRNAIDHGIEKPEERVSKGKSESGTINLNACYEGNEIIISIEDDGSGINREKVLAKAEERGLLKANTDTISDKDVFLLLFEPGFSTAKEITDISGRGVGLDVVKKNIEKLRGNVDIRSSFGKGSKISLRIPLTLAIMDSMVIRIGDAMFALPILSLRESLRPHENMITVTMDGLELVNVRNEILPVIRLHDTFGIVPDNHELNKGILLIVVARDKKVCFFADEIVGQQQAVIKGLSDYIGKVQGITGCMILADGGIGLIIDIEGIIAMSEDLSITVL